MSQRQVKVYDTLSGKKQIFEPLNSPRVKIYGCGPTVYGYTHVGNARAFLTQDLVVRVLKSAGYDVMFARNYTDVDDKIIKRAKDENKSSEEVAQFYTEAFDRDMKALDVLPPDVTPRATTSMPQIIKMIEALESKGLAYAAAGDVYFRVEKFSRYGCLSHRKLKDMMSGTRVEVGEQKESVVDFALWKAAKPGEPSWESPWGKGRPGWHIECSAMNHEIFDDSLDIHMGGLDLIFPHHENEIAQSEGFSGKTFARYWIHNGMLEVGQEKMSKSVGNLMTISDFVRDYGAETLRVLFSQHHYRNPLEFSAEAILRAEALVDRFYLCKQKALAHSGKADENEKLLMHGHIEKILESFYDDFNSAKALGFILPVSREAFRHDREGLWSAWGLFLPLLNDLFAICKKNPETALQENHARRLKRMNISREESDKIDGQLKDREDLRLQKKFLESDQIRKDLEARGIQVMDGPDGSSWTMKGSL